MALSWQGGLTPCLIVIFHQELKSKTLSYHVEMHIIYFHLLDECMVCIPNDNLMEYNSF